MDSDREYSLGETLGHRANLGSWEQDGAGLCRRKSPPDHKKWRKAKEGYNTFCILRLQLPFYRIP